MKLKKEQFNHMVATNQIDVRPNDTAYINNIEYKIQPVESHHTEVTLKEIGLKEYKHPYTPEDQR